MDILKKKTLAMQIHGKTNQEVAECWIEKGQSCEVRSRYRDALGTLWVSIEIDGYRYDVLPSDLEHSGQD